VGAVPRHQGDDGLCLDYLAGMSLPPDQPPPSSPAKLSAEERRARQADRLTTIRLRMAIGEALGMPTAEATRLLNRRQWREGDVELLEAAAARLGVKLS
jgi:hypothetical protein